MDKYTNDENIFKRIRDGDQALIKKIHYEYWDYFCSYFLKNKGIKKKEIIKDFYADAFTILCIKIRDGKLNLPLKSKLTSYLISVGNNVLLRYYDQLNRNREDPTEDLSKLQKGHLDPDVEAYYENNNNKDLVRRLLSKLGAKCQKMLRLSYIESNADDAIAVKMNIPNTNGVRQMRFRCMNKLRSILKDK